MITLEIDGDTVSAVGDRAAAIADADPPVGWRKHTPRRTHAGFLWFRKCSSSGRMGRFPPLSPGASSPADAITNGLALSRTSRATGEKFQQSPRQKRDIAAGRTYARGRACSRGDKPSEQSLALRLSVEYHPTCASRRTGEGLSRTFRSDRCAGRSRHNRDRVNLVRRSTVEKDL